MNKLIHNNYNHKTKNKNKKSINKLVQRKVIPNPSKVNIPAINLKIPKRLILSQLTLFRHTLLIRLHLLTELPHSFESPSRRKQPHFACDEVLGWLFRGPRHLYDGVVLPLRMIDGDGSVGHVLHCNASFMFSSNLVLLPQHYLFGLNLIILAGLQPQRLGQFLLNPHLFNLAMLRIHLNNLRVLLQRPGRRYLFHPFILNVGHISNGLTLLFGLWYQGLLFLTDFLV